MSPIADIPAGGGPDSVDEIAALVVRIIVELRPGTVPEDVSADMSLLDGGLDLDSVALIELITAMEKRLGFEFLQSDLRTCTFGSLRTLAQVVRLRRQQRADVK